MVAASCASVSPRVPAASSGAAVTGTASPAASASTDVAPSPLPSAAASPSSSADPSPSPSAEPRPYRIDVWHSYALVTQSNLLYCVPGAAAIMVDLVRGRRAVDASVLPDMYAYGQTLAAYQNEGPGVDPVGWVGILDRWGAPGYTWRSYATLDEALHHAAMRLRATGRPIGLNVGIHRMHAWVITGFTTTADPASGAFSVTGVAITGPLWPFQRYYLGYFDMPPDTWLTPAKLAPAVRPFHADVPTRWDGRYVTIEP